MRTLRNLSEWRSRLRLVLGVLGMVGLLAAALPAIGAGAAAVVAAAAPSATIEIENFKFLPPDLTVAAGTTVVWKNSDDSPHRIADKNGAYASVALDTNDSYSRTFFTPGVYYYLCSIHPYMVGTIVVK
jgi:plastocyanin